MTITRQSLEQLNNHWAVQAISHEDIQRASSVATTRLVQSAVGGQMNMAAVDILQDQALLERVALAYELAALGGLNALLRLTVGEQEFLLRQQAQAGAYRAFEIRRVLPLPEGRDKLVFHVLHLAALAYSGERWPDLRRWLNENGADIAAPSTANVEWDRRVLYRVYDCWIRLFRKQGWNDLDSVREIIAGLRGDQERFESEVLTTKEGSEKKAYAFRLVALYHWARATEILAAYMLTGSPPDVVPVIDQHFEEARKAAVFSEDAPLDVLLGWLHVASRRMVAGSIWWVAHTVNSRVSRFVSSVTKSRSLFELLPPQRAALQEQGLLDQASKAIVVDLPTSGGKTVLAQFRMLQALNQFDGDNGWVVYLAPTRALVTQITRRLRNDFEPIGVRVEQLTAAVEIDSFEQTMLESDIRDNSFNVLVSTPEKFHLIIRNKVINRPLALVVMDEAHNIEDEERGLRIELLLATIKRDCPTASFLLLMPNVPNAEELAKWLAPESGKTISIGTSPWQPNERLVGMFYAERDSRAARDWSLRFETLITPRSIDLHGVYRTGTSDPLDLPFSQAQSLSTLSVAMAKTFSDRGTSIAVGRRIDDVWSMARTAARVLSPLAPLPREVQLVQRFLQTEISSDFELVELLGKGVAVHHAGLSDEARSLIEWLAEENKLRILCTTTTISQGINFPVGSVFLASPQLPVRGSKRMSPRAFWNLAGRAGRVEHGSVGVVGIAAGNNPEAIRAFVSEATGALVSRLIELLNEVDARGQLGSLVTVIQGEQWADFRSYVAHLWNEKKNLDLFLADSEQLLRNTFGYGVLQGRDDHRKTTALLDATRAYARQIAEHPENAVLADATGFSPEGVRNALLSLSRLEHRLSISDWQPNSLFGPQSALPQLIGIMMKVPEIQSSISELSAHGMDHTRISEIAQAWVGGQSIELIARAFFKTADNSMTDAITDTCKGIYRALANATTWGLSALSKIGLAGVDTTQLPEEVRRSINSIGAMLYHGVHTEEAVVMRMNAVPRSIAEPLGRRFQQTSPPATSSSEARQFLRSLSETDWQACVPPGATLTGADYRNVWARLSGESAE